MVEVRTVELAITISYPTSASGIIFLLKMHPKDGPLKIMCAYHTCQAWSIRLHV